MLLIRLLFAIDAVVAAVVVYFYFIGIADGSVSDFNMALWTTILAAVVVVLGAGWVLHANGRRRTAVLVLSILAVPGVLFGLFMLLIVITQPNWN